MLRVGIVDTVDAREVAGWVPWALLLDFASHSNVNMFQVAASQSAHSCCCTPDDTRVAKLNHVQRCVGLHSIWVWLVCVAFARRVHHPSSALCVQQRVPVPCALLLSVMMLSIYSMAPCWEACNAHSPAIKSACQHRPNTSLYPRQLPLQGP